MSASPITLTRVTKDRGETLSKCISLGEDGFPVSDGSKCSMTNGVAERITLDPATPATSLANEIDGLKSSQAILLGDHVAEEPAISIVTAKRANPAHGQYARTQQFIKFAAGQPAPLLLDHDRKGMPKDVADRIEAVGGFQGALASILAVDYSTLARVTRTSTSTGIYNTVTDERFKAGGGFHVYLFSEDGSDNQRFLDDLEDRAWLAGLGWIMRGKIGQALVRSIIDTAVGGPERLIFEGKPLMLPPLDQDQAERVPVAHEGLLLDTRAACPPLTDEERKTVAELKRQARIATEPEAEKAVEAAVADLVKRKGISTERARATIIASTKGNLTSWAELHFDDDELGLVTVTDVIADPARYHEETLADPLEGRWYGTGKAKLYWNGGANVIINSFGHGGGKFPLKHSMEFVEVEVEAAGGDAAKTFAKLMPWLGDHDPIDRDRIRNLAVKLSGVSKSALNEAVDRAEKAARADELRERARKKEQYEGAKSWSDGPSGETFGGAPAGDPYAEFHTACAKINEQFFVVQISASVVIGTYIKCQEMGREQLSFMKPQDFRLLYNNQKHLTGHTLEGKPIYTPLGDAWLTSTLRREYKGAGFYTKGEAPAGMLNLWRGWGHPPTRGDWETLASHLLHVICDGDPDTYEYTVKLLAYWAQHPEKLGEVSLVMRGLKGTGKGTLVDILKRWFLHHFVHISQAKHLTGNFNAHLADCLLLYADEVVWGGDKQAEGTLKALVTERVVQIEPKGINSFSMPNRLKIVQASNAEWCVPVTGDERRYLVHDVNESKIGNRPYFNALHAAIQGGEAEAMLHDLLEMDLSDFSHRDVPHTDGLNRQKIEGLDSVGKWWMSCLEEGRIVGFGHFSEVLEAKMWPMEVVKAKLHAAYLEHSNNHGERHPKAEHVFPHAWKKIAPSIESGRKRGMSPHWELQSLRDHRAEFLKAMKIDRWKWPEIDEAEEKQFAENVHNFRRGK